MGVYEFCPKLRKGLSPNPSIEPESPIFKLQELLSLAHLQEVEPGHLVAS
jgi:hypothetical protein